MASPTVEDYLKRVYLESRSLGDRLVPMGRLASAMGVVPGTATSMVKALAESGLAEYEPRSGVRLSAAGERLALHVIRRHRLIELFLVRVLGLDWSEVHPEAERLEHAISDRVLERLDTLLGHPTADPHGDPIPTQWGAVVDPHRVSLEDCVMHRCLTVTRVTDQDPAFLEYAGRSGLTPGSPVTVKERNGGGDVVLLCTGDGATVALGKRAAAKILVE